MILLKGIEILGDGWIYSSFFMVCVSFYDLGIGRSYFYYLFDIWKLWKLCKYLYIVGL